MPRNNYKKMGIATLIMMTSIFLSRILGYAREMVIAAVAGADASVDAYRVAFSLPEILNHVLASGFLSVTFIPIFSKYLAKKDEEGAWNIFSIILTTFGSLLLILVALCMVYADKIVPLLASGRQDPDFFQMAVHMTRIVIPAQIFFFTGGILMAVQFAKEQFWIPALAPLIYNIGIITAGILLGPYIGIAGFSWGVLAGAFIGNFLIQIIGARKVGLRFKFRFNIRHKEFHQYIMLTLPLMVGLTMVFSMEVFSKYFGSHLPDGGIAWLDYAKTVMMMLVGFFGQAVGVAAFPFLARLAAEEKFDELNGIFNTLLRHLAALVIPTAILMYVLRIEIVRVLFERGDFSSNDTHMTALALTGLLVGAVAIASMTVVNRGFYAMQNTWLPALYGTIAVLLSLPLYWFGLKIYGLIGVALAISFSAIIQVVVLFVVWNRRSQNAQQGQVYMTYAKTAMAGLPLAGTLWTAHRYLIQHFDTSTFFGCFGVIGCVTAIFVVLMGLSGWIFNVAGIRFIGERLLHRIRPRSKRISKP